MTNTVTMTSSEQSVCRRALDEIHEAVDRLTELTMWTVKASQRFRVGDRVQFSIMADRRGVSRRRKGAVRTGKVTSIDDPMSIRVLLDGYKRDRNFHHMFFEKVQ